MKHEDQVREREASFAARTRFVLYSFFSLSLFFTFCITGVPSSFAQTTDTLLKIVPADTIDFGRVRLGHQRDSLFTIENNGTFISQQLELIDLNYSVALLGTDFTSDNIKSPSDSLILDPKSNPTASDTIHFRPTTLGPAFGNIPITWIDILKGDTLSTPNVVLRGIGVAPHVVSSGDTFPDVRVDSTSLVDSIYIVNRGTDTTAIDAVTIVNTSDLADFLVALDSFPPSKPRTLPLGYEGKDTALMFEVQFQPKSLGQKMLVIRIHTVDDSVLFDTIWGRGVEPLVLLDTNVIDFGTILVQKNGSPDSTVSESFVISNTGTFPAVLDTLTDRDTAGNFTVLAGQPPISHETLAVGSNQTVLVQFNITQEGDFFDTVFIPNDTRYGLYSVYSTYQPTIVLKAKVRTGSIGSYSASFDTIRSCDTVSDTVLVTNPYPVEVYIDSIALVSDTAGFSYRQNTFLHKISIPPNGSYPLYLDYSFPYDSVNGSQVMKMALFQRHLDNDPTVVDTVTATLVRKEQIVTLSAQLPAAGATGTSAADITELRLPITFDGPRSGVTEFNNWTLSFQFSNDLFAPTGIDTTGSLSVPGDPSYSLTTYWDQSTRTYTIIATGTAVSDPAKIANKLLFTMLMQAYVTTDTVVTISPLLAWAQRPCAYALQSFTLSLPYAEDCGNQTLREFMQGGTPSFILTGTWPDPVINGDGVSIGYRAGLPCQVKTSIFSESGEQLGHVEETIGAGIGTINLPQELLPASGLAFIRVEAVSNTNDANGGISTIQNCKVAVMK